MNGQGGRGRKGVPRAHAGRLTGQPRLWVSKRRQYTELRHWWPHETLLTSLLNYIIDADITAVVLPLPREPTQNYVAFVLKPSVIFRVASVTARQTHKTSLFHAVLRATCTLSANLWLAPKTLSCIKSPYFRVLHWQFRILSVPVRVKFSVFMWSQGFCQLAV